MMTIKRYWLIIYSMEFFMAKCEVCGKSVLFGNNVSHSNRKSQKIWKSNIKKVRVLDGKQKVRKYVCTRCIRSNRILKAV